MRGKNKISGFMLYFILFTVITILCGCSSKITEKTEQKESLASENYEKGHSLLDEGKMEEAIDYYLKALEEVNNQTQSQMMGDILKNNIYNDLSEAYYQLQQYDTSLEYIEKALSTKPNEYYEYINRGNAYYSLNKDEESEADYNEALSMNPDAKYAIYGLGSLYYDHGKYEDALEMFNKYLVYDETDMDAIMYVIDCYSNLGDNEEGIAFIDKKLETDSNNYDLLKAKGEFLNKIGNFEDAEAFYKEMMTTYTDPLEAGVLLGELYYNNSKYDKALDCFMELSEDFPADGEVNSWIIYCYEALDDFDNAMKFYQTTIDNGYESYEIYNAVGNLFLNKYMYMESVPYIEKAIKLNGEDSEPYNNMLYALYYGKRYSKCIEFGKTIVGDFPSEINIPWYMGDCYYALSNYEEALVQFQNALELNPDHEEILAEAADTCLMLEDYEMAEEYAEECLAINPENSKSQEVKNTITEKEKPIGIQLKDFIKDSYLYSDETDAAEVINTISKEEDLSNTQIADVIEKMKHPDDEFTFVISDDVYDYFSDSKADEIEFNENGNEVYLRINGFYINTDNNVIEMIDKIKDPENKNLIIDLRDNTGGLTDCANNILDVLLGDCVTSTLIDKDGYTYNFYSDASQVKFKKIYIFVNDYTASASELLTLGCKTFLDNVTIVGQNTYGKGVGQIVFEDKERKLMVYLVNHYWNVREQNIMSSGITPDIKVKSDKLEDYLKVIKK